MIERKEIKELSEWLTNLIRANESSDLPYWAKEKSQVWVYTIDDCYNKYLSTTLPRLTENDKKIQYLDLRCIEYVSARDWASDSSVWPQGIYAWRFFEWQQNIPEIKERWNTLQDLIDEIKEYEKRI